MSEILEFGERSWIDTADCRLENIDFEILESLGHQLFETTDILQKSSSTDEEDEKSLAVIGGESFDSEWLIDFVGVSERPADNLRQFTDEVQQNKRPLHDERREVSIAVKETLAGWRYCVRDRYINPNIKPTNGFEPNILIEKRYWVSVERSTGTVFSGVYELSMQSRDELPAKDPDIEISKNDKKELAELASSSQTFGRHQIEELEEILKAVQPHLINR